MSIGEDDGASVEIGSDSLLDSDVNQYHPLYHHGQKPQFANSKKLIQGADSWQPGMVFSKQGAGGVSV